MDAFLKTAVVGTAQVGARIPTAGDAVDALTQQLPAAGGERSFLLAAAAQSIYTQAGMIAPEAPAPLPIAAPETMPTCSMRVAQLIEGLFQQPHNILLPEALQRLRHSQQRLPHECLPQYISYATSHREFRETIAPLLGERGRWLSQFVPEWGWITQQGQQPEADLETIWQEGTPPQRQQVLQQMRQKDPARAREWLQAVWKQEKAEIRLAFLAQMRGGLSLDDHSFLELALLDRSEGVREQAADLILLLPESPLTQRFLAAADQFISYDPSRISNKLTITIPDQLDDASKEALAPSARSSWPTQPEQWLQLAFSKISPAHWEERLGLSPQQIVTELVENRQKIWQDKSDTYGKFLLQQLQVAARRHHSLAWYQPLLQYLLYLPSRQRPETRVCHEMLAELPQPVTDALIEPLLRDKYTWEAATELLPAPWSQEFSLHILQVLRAYYKDTNTTSQQHYYWNVGLPRVASALHPSCLQEAQQPWEIDENDTSWYVQDQKRQIATFIEIIEQRKQMLEEIA
ncbi:DUF5691 domain-containing protein [Dictyobacter aurantiacus]|uniref:Uncharacterized protein n=1 Tax=Dictyobacter aurantiacus TaxID=1936993 RepID=A0A401ZIB4_9CHLR|nr:DUF5691 domain-containing protein [Dictyobacter aurantiacus]GCE06585.1 hypothetical protein KDAU_39140 [Dictyobacter aurantiacus]